MNNHAVRMVIYGNVQGVFFRDHTRRLAKQAGVTGWVRNCPDGTVEAKFEGPEEVLQRLVLDVEAGSPQSTVTGVDIDWQAPVEGLNEFSVR